VVALEQILLLEEMAALAALLLKQRPEQAI